MEFAERVELEDQSTTSTNNKELELIDNPNATSTTRSSSKIVLFFSWIFPRFFAVIFFIILFLWIFRAEGGIGFTESNLFGWHALLMSLFIVIFTQEAILSFSAPLISPSNRTTSKFSMYVVCVCTLWHVSNFHYFDTGTFTCSAMV